MKKLLCMIALAAICFESVSAAVIPVQTDTTVHKKVKRHHGRMKKMKMKKKVRKTHTDTTNMKM